MQIDGVPIADDGQLPFAKGTTASKGNGCFSIALSTKQKSLHQHLCIEQ